MLDEINCPLPKTAIFRFYGDLNWLLKPRRRGRETPLSFKGRQTVKHLIESLGVPHTEVGLILLDGRMVDWGYIPSSGDRLAVFPHFEQIDISPQYFDLSPMNEQPRFVLDGHLGRLAAYLRMLGFDAVYKNHVEDAELAILATREGRILLTRDRGLLKRKEIIYGCCLLTLDPCQQLLQVVRRYHLIDHLKPFTRCMACNGHLAEVPKEEVQSELEPKTRKYFNEFKRCADCNKVYWAGSHHVRMEGLIDWLKQQQSLPY